MQPHHPLIALLSIFAQAAAIGGQDKRPEAPAAAFDQAAQISEYVREVFQDREGHFWFGTNSDGVCRLDGKSLTYISVEQGLGGAAIRGIVQDSAGAMWFATNGGVSRYEGGKFTNYTTANGLSDNEVWSMMSDRAGTLWVGTHEGVCRFDGKSFVPFPIPRVTVENLASRFSPKVVFGMTQDKAGNLWFGTDGEGAHKYDGKSFTSYTTKDGLAGNQVRCIYSDRRGRIWVGTDGGGVSCFDGKAITNFTAKDGLNNDRVFEVLEDKAGNLWFSTLGAGACRYDGKSFTSFREDRGLSRSHVQSMFEDKDGALWFGCSGGLFRLKGESFVNVTRNGPWPKPVRSSAPAPTAEGSAIVHQPGPVSLEGWAAETIPLPPGFAPELPTGTESLRFAPGWRDPSAEGFWSYAFVMWIDESAPDAARIDGLLEKYYDGLMSSFAADKGKDISSTPARVEVVRSGPNHFEAQMRLVDAFATFEPIDLRVVVDTVSESDERASLRIQVSPQSKEHAIWRSLEAAITRILSSERAPLVKQDGKAVDPMASFARMETGEWRRPTLTSIDMFETWNWGPGKHSMLAQTYGTGIDGEPVRNVEVFYWHPGRKQVCLLGLSPFAHGVSEGTIQFEGETADAVFDLYQTRDHRKMGLRWKFDGPDRYHSILLESTGPAGLSPMNEWDYVRFKTLTAKPPIAEEASRPSGPLKVFEPLLGHTWEAKGNWAGEGAFHIQSTFEWIPYANGIRVRTVSPAEHGEPTHLLDAYIYLHTGTQTLRCLALSNQGGVYDGQLSVLDGAALQLDLKGYGGDRVEHHIVRFDFEPDGSLRHRHWSLEGSERVLVLDVRCKKLVPKQD